MKVEFKVQGLSCGHCVNSVSTIIKSISGVLSYQVNLPDMVTVEFDETKTSLDFIKNEINQSEIYKAI